MALPIISTVRLDTPKPWWLPLLTLCMTLYGILVQGWNFQPIVFMFWMEVICLLAAASIRTLFALEGLAWTATLLKRLGLTAFSVVMGIAMLMLTVTFTFKAFDGGFSSAGFAQVPVQVRILWLGYAAGLGFHYFANRQYRTAHPISEMMSGLLHVLLLLCLIMPITMHLLPAFPQLNQAMWAGITVTLVKFVVDGGFNKTRKHLAAAFSA